jgi:hypothetical protein
VCGAWLLGCHAPQQPGLVPAALTFDDAFVGLPNDLPLSFQLDGKPVASPLYSVTGSSAAIDCEAFPSDQPPVFRCHPNVPGSSSLSLTITILGKSFVVPVTVHARLAPDCGSAADECLPNVIDPGLRRCVPQAVADGTVCTPAIADGQPAHACQQGQCLVRMLPPRPITACLATSTGAPVRLQPAWTWSLTPWVLNQQTLPAIDAAGNAYLLLEQSGPKSLQRTSADLVSINPGGQTRWRQTLPLVNPPGLPECAGEPNFQLLIVGSRLIVFSPCLPQTLQARDLDAGLLAWSQTINAAWAYPREAAGISALVDLGGGQIAWMDPTNANLAAIDVITGKTGASVSLGLKQTVTLISDGQGNVLAGSPGPMPGAQGLTLAANLLSGVLWQESWSSPVAAEGDRLFTCSGEVLAAPTGAFVSTLGDHQVMTPDDIVADAAHAFALHGTLSSSSSRSVLLHRFGPSAGNTFWRCHIEPVGETERLFLTQGGGVALMGLISNAPRILVFDDTGAIVTDMATGPLALGSAVISGHRLLAPADDAASTLVAYELPSFELAPHGWVCDGGNPAHDYAPW